MGLIALGTDKGSISLWDLKRGTVVHSLGEVSVFALNMSHNVIPPL